jgi:Leucine-rich repeat (LRR) protein
VTSLQELDLSSNRLTSLPETLLRSLGGLTRLHVSHNRLEALPEAVGHLTALQVHPGTQNQKLEM